METLRVELGDRSYDICIGYRTLGGLGSAVADLAGVGNKIALMSNPTVYALYGDAVRASLEAAGLDVIEIIIPDGEQYKSIEWFKKAHGEMLSARMDRASVIVALGGGVIGDLAGFVAATYMRGIRFVQVPTTLLAQVDSSVGGKTGVNHALGKNMIGAFWQPSLVWMDLDVLSTLPRRELLAGLSEVIKYGVIWDREFFDFLSAEHELVMELEPETVTRIVSTSCWIKAEVVSRDEREGGLRAILNYGHTIGHAIETLTGYKKYLHGEAVAMGMYAEAALAEHLGIMEPGGAVLVREVLENYGMLNEMPDGLDAQAMIAAMSVDKKAVGGEMKFILPESIGKVRVNETVSAEVMKEFLG